MANEIVQGSLKCAPEEIVTFEVDMHNLLSSTMADQAEQEASTKVALRACAATSVDSYKCLLINGFFRKQVTA